MRISRIAIAGALFGMSAIGSAVIYAAVTSSSVSQQQSVAVFSTDPLSALTRLSPEQLPSSPAATSLYAKLDGAATYKAVQSGDVTGYLARKADGDLCAIVSQAGTVGMGCGSARDVAAGRVVLRLQFRETDPAVFVGLAANDVTAVTAGAVKAIVQNNMWLAVTEPSVESCTLFGVGKTLTVNTGSESGKPPAESPSPNRP